MARGVTRNMDMKMKSNNINNIIFTIIFTLLLAAVLTGCLEVGTGPEVDLTPPTLTLSSPTDNSTKPYLFTLKGNAEDNGKIDRIEVSFGDEAGLSYLWQGGTTWKKKSAMTKDVYTEIEGSGSKMVIKDGKLSFKIGVDLKETLNVATERSFTVTAQAFDVVGNSGKMSKAEVSFNIDTGDPQVSIDEPLLFSGSYAEVSNEIGVADDEGYTLRDASVIQNLNNEMVVLRGHQEGSIVYDHLMIELDSAEGNSDFGTVNAFDEDCRAATGYHRFDDDVTVEQIAAASDVNFCMAGAKTYYRRKFSLKAADGGGTFDDNGDLLKDLRNWFVKIKKADLIQGFGVKKDNEVSETKDNAELETGKHLIRVVSTSVSSSGSWERRVLGYFIWWPESDEPWAELYSLDPVIKSDDKMAEVYPSSNITGVAYDDDGLAQVRYKVTKWDDEKSDYITEEKPKGYTPSGTLAPTDTGDPNPKNWQYTIPSPGVEGKYKIEVWATDKVDKVRDGEDATSGIEQKEPTVGYFRTSDIKAPVVDIGAYDTKGTLIAGKVKTTDPISGEEVETSLSGAITQIDGETLTLVLKGKVSDDGDINCLKIAYIDPSLTGDAATKNLINFMTGGYKGWDTQNYKTGSHKDGTNIVYTLGAKEAGGLTLSSNPDDLGSVYTFEKRLTLSDLGIDGVTKTLSTQQFVVMAIDKSHATSVPKVLTLMGDTSAPELTFDTIQDLSNGGAVINFESLPTPKFETQFSTAKITGTWADDSTALSALWADPKSRIKITWRTGKNILTSENIAITTTGSNWEATAKNISPDSMSSVTVTINDFAGNEKSVTHNYYVSSDGLSLMSISTLDEDIASSAVGGRRYDAMSDGVFLAGDTLALTTVFSENVTFSGGNPKLRLNIKNASQGQAYATYVHGNDTTTHTYVYTVRAGDYIGAKVSDLELLDATIDDDGGKVVWKNKDVNAGEVAKTVSMTPKTSLATAHNITIDTLKPTIASISTINESGWYNEGKNILITFAMSEDISCDNPQSASLTLCNTKDASQTFTTDTTYTSGKNLVVFIYNVGKNQNALPLKVKSLNLGSGGSAAVIKDNAGNSLTTLTLPKDGVLDKNINIDTVAPTAPSVTFMDISSSAVLTPKTVSGNKMIFVYGNGAKFSIQGESGSTSYYRVFKDGAATAAPQIYTGTVSLVSNGSYKIQAKQIDAAGNDSTGSDGSLASGWSEAVTLKIDKGALLQKMTTSVSAESKLAAGKVLDVVLTFRKAVTISSGAQIALNIKNGSTVKKATLNDTGFDTKSNTLHRFTYTIAEGDAIPSTSANLSYEADPSERHAIVKVTSLWTDSKGITYVKDADAQDVPIVMGDIAEGSKFFDAGNKTIQVLTGKPTLITTGSEKPLLSGTTLTLTFDRDIFIGSGTMTFTQTSAYRAPIVLTKDEYNTLKAAAPSAASFYSAGVNGATKNSDNTLTKDTSTKYILKYDKTESDTTLVNALKAAGYDKVELQSFSSNIKTSGKKVIVTLTGADKLPTLGATYSVALSAGFVADEIGNKSAASTITSLTSSGLEPPVIRMKSASTTINCTRNSMTDNKTTKFKISSRNDGDTIYYSTSGLKSTVTLYGGGPSQCERYSAEVKPTSSPEVNSNPGTLLGNHNDEVTLGGDEGSLGENSSNRYNKNTCIVIHSKKYNRIIVKSLTGGTRFNENEGGMPMARESFEYNGNNYVNDDNRWNTITLFGTEATFTLNMQSSANDKKPDLSRNAGEWWYNNGTWTSTNPNDSNQSDYYNRVSTRGLKYAICAVSKKGGVTSSPSYETAHRSVLYFEITPQYGSASEGAQNPAPNDKDVWVRGGDQENGDNGTPNFPLSWNTSDYSGIHKMTGINYLSGRGEGGPIRGMWCYVTWDLPDAAYLGFVTGNTPGDAQSKGPSKWQWVTGSWTVAKPNFKWYPGETLHLRSWFGSRFTGFPTYETNYDNGAHDVSQASTHPSNEERR